MLLLGLVSSDRSLCRAISEQLKNNAAWQLAVFPSLEEALAVWSDVLPALVFWDAERAAASEEMAVFFASRLTQARPAPLLLVLGAAPQAIGQEGVTEQFARPLRLGYFMSRLQFYERLLSRAPDVTMPLGPWLFAPRARTLSPRSGGENVKLTDKEAALLEYLCAACAPASREELLAALWGYDARIDTHTLETHIYRLRKKIAGADSRGEDVFLTEEGGYRINPAWREI